MSKVPAPRLTDAQMTAVYEAVVVAVMARFDDPYSGDPVLSETEARLIAGHVREIIDAQAHDPSTATRTEE